MSVKCGHCGSYGQTVAHVRECSNPSGRRHLKSLVSAQPVGDYPQPGDVLGYRKEDGTMGIREFNPTLAQQPEEGIFVKNETIFKVVSGTSTGNFYAKEYVGDSTWEYRGRAPLHFLTALDRITAEEAARFGQVTGSCVFCSRKLTDERSIHVGYGPVCAERERLPWGEYIPASIDKALWP